MQAPSHWWTIGCALSMAAWSTYSTWHVRRIWAPAHAAQAAGEAARRAFADAATEDEKLRYAAVLTDSLGPQTAAVGRARQWNDHIYTPVMVALAVPTLVLAVWGVL